MLTKKQVDEVKRLLASCKHSQRNIAVMTGVSRGTVAAIANETRHIYTREPNPDDWRPEGPVVRCPRCGGRTRLPCRVCYIRDTVAERGRVDWGTFRNRTLIELQLRPQHDKRYQKIRRWREIKRRPFNPELDDLESIDTMTGNEDFRTEYRES